jgi:hypothetical protein
MAGAEVGRMSIGKASSEVGKKLKKKKGGTKALNFKVEIE